MNPIKTLSGATESEKNQRCEFSKLMRESPIPDSELGMNLGIYQNRMQLSRVLLMHRLYKKIVPIHGVVMEFGVRWGQNLALFSNFRGMYEPYNYNRKIIGFDTFSGFPSVNEKDGLYTSVGDYSVSEDYLDHLTSILHAHESQSPIPNKKKFELVVGDATQTIHQYLSRHPETIIAFAYFDFDIYLPTKACLEAILPRCSKGAVLAFDELNCPEFPGETIAFMEAIGVGKYSLKRDPHNPLTAWMVLE
jgi:hypothetical protein